ncbi:MAG: AAA family ATPase [Candidatus Delongbacteria bacterium]
MAEKKPHQLADSYRLIGLSAENFLRLKAVRIAFDPKANAAELSGENGQGKSSVIKAIWTALGGAKVLEDERVPVHEDADKASITLDLAPADDARAGSPRRIRITRTISADGGWGLKIWTPDKGSFPSPQAILDTFFHTLCFDPSEFVRMDQKKRNKVMIDLAGVGDRITPLKVKRQGIYDERTGINRDLKNAQARLDEMEPPDLDVPAEVSLTELNRQIDEARRKEEANEHVRRELQGLYDAHAEAKQLVADLEARLTTARDRVEELVALGQEKKKSVLALVDPGLQALRDKLQTAETDNEQARTARKYAEETTEVERLQGRSEELTSRIDAVNDEIAQVLLSATFPIPDLAITEEGDVVYRGKLFEQASDAERLEVSLAMGAAMNPRLRFLALREASMMTERTRDRVKAWAAEHDVLVLFELATSQHIGIHIEDGEVAGQAAEGEQQEESHAA